MFKQIIASVLAMMLLASCTGKDHAQTIKGTSAVMRKLFSLKTTQAFRITIPDDEIQAELTDFCTIDSLEMACGRYQDGFERGTVYLHYRHLVTVQDACDGPVFTFVAPFAVSNQGSGVFWYLGVFTLNTTTAVMHHTDSMFLGDRIIFDAVSVSSETVCLRFYVHDANQAMCERPTLLQQREITVTPHGLQ